MKEVFRDQIHPPTSLQGYGVHFLFLEKVLVLAKSFDIYSNANIHTVMLLPMMLDSATDATAPFFGIAIN